jgi:hypothetical protein
MSKEMKKEERGMKKEEEKGETREERERWLLVNIPFSRKDYQQWMSCMRNQTILGDYTTTKNNEVEFNGLLQIWSTCARRAQYFTRKKFLL